MTIETLTYSGQLVIHACWCGIRHSIPAELDRQARHNRKPVFCPLGHEWVIQKSDAELERAKRVEAENEAAFWRNANRERLAELDAERRTNAALRGHLTRWRKRVANGVCPVAGCKRHFPNVQAHVATEHPDWLAGHPEVFADNQPSVE